MDMNRSKLVSLEAGNWMFLLKFFSQSFGVPEPQNSPTACLPARTAQTQVLYHRGRHIQPATVDVCCYSMYYSMGSSARRGMKTAKVSASHSVIHYGKVNAFSESEIYRSIANREGEGGKFRKLYLDVKLCAALGMLHKFDCSRKLKVSCWISKL